MAVSLVDKNSSQNTNQKFSGRIPPHSREAEQSVLGAILIDNEAVNSVLEILQPGDFHIKQHQLLFAGMIALFDRGEPIDVVTLTQMLRTTSDLDAAGGIEYISQLVEIVPTSANAQYYARLVKSMSLRRNLIHEAGVIVDEAFAADEDVETLLDTVEQKIFKLSESRINKGFYRVSDVVKDSIKQVEKHYISKEPITGLASGFYDLDNITAGFQPSDLIILAGRPSMGKTSLALSMALNVGLNPKRAGAVAIFSLEMSKEQIVTRLLCSRARVSSSKIRSGKLSETDFPRLVEAASELSHADVFIDDTSAISVLEMRAKARRLHREKPLSRVVVVYLQLMRGSSRSSDRRDQEISEISGALKGLAKELNIPVVALSQLNRGVESRDNKRPHMADLRESGAIEQDADLISFVYRDEVYNPDTPDKGVAEVIVSKHRNGPIGTVKLAFQGEYTLFENLSEEAAYDYLGEDLGAVGDELL